MDEPTVLIIDGNAEPDVVYRESQESVILLTTAGVPGPPGPPGPVGGQIILDDHIDSPTPHPAYDDIPDLSLLFDNSLL